jgi:hypothetical protein
MQRCRQCEATMTPTETECLNCGATIEVKTAKDEAKAKFRSVIKLLMFASAAMAAASIFVDVGPSFTTCMCVTVVLGLVLNSAEEMLIGNKDK